MMDSSKSREVYLCLLLQLQSNRPVRWAIDDDKLTIPAASLPWWTEVITSYTSILIIVSNKGQTKPDEFYMQQPIINTINQFVLNRGQRVVDRYDHFCNEDAYQTIIYYSFLYSVYYSLYSCCGCVAVVSYFHTLYNIAIIQGWKPKGNINLKLLHDVFLCTIFQKTNSKIIILKGGELFISSDMFFYHVTKTPLLACCVNLHNKCLISTKSLNHPASKMQRRDCLQTALSPFTFKCDFPVILLKMYHSP